MIETGLLSVWTQLDRVQPIHLSLVFALLLASLTWLRRRLDDGRTFNRSTSASNLAAR